MILGRIALGAFLFVLTIPGFAFSENIQADMQCPPGGVVGQQCQDMTNGYVTKGHCTHIGVCKADSWHTDPPKGCGSSGNIYAPTPDCPKAPPVSSGITTPTPTTSVITIGSNTAVSSIFDQAFSGISESPMARINTVSTTTLDGIEYFISDGEALVAGSKLTAEAPVSAPPRSSLALGSIYDLRPSQPTRAVPVTSAYGQNQEYRPPVVGFSTTISTNQETEQVNFGNHARDVWNATFRGVNERFVDFLLYASALSPETVPTVTVAGPYASMYQQIRDSNATFLKTQSSNNRAPRDYMFAQRFNEVGVLFRDALYDVGTAGSKLFTGDVPASTNAIGSAAWRTANAFGLLGNIAASGMLRVVLWN